MPRILAAAVITAALCGCSSPQKQLEQAQKKIDGLTATTRTIAEAWLSGDVSATYSRTAFEQTLELLDQQRASLGTSPALLLDARGASLSRDAEQLSRLLAALIEDARNRDGASARQHLSEVAGARQ